MTRAGLAPGDIGNVAYVTKGSGVILARVRFRREDGREGRVSRTGPSKAAARRAVMEAAREQMTDFELDAGLTLNRDSTLRELVEAYLAVQSERNEAGTPQYLNDEAAIARKYIAEQEFGTTTLRKLRPSLIKAEHRRILQLKKTGRARQFATIIRKLCDYAYELDLVSENPAVGLKLNRPKSHKKKAATAGEVDQLRAVAHAYINRPNRKGPKPSPLLLDVADVVAGTGLRIGEVLALRWREDVHLDVERPVIFVRGTVVEGHRIRKHRQPSPKTLTSERGIEIPAFLIETLRRRKAESLGQHSLVFETSSGAPVGPHQVRVQLWKVRNWAATQDDQPNIDPDVAMHALRRGVATLVSDEHDIVVAAKVLGNGQAAITEKHYAHKNLLAPDVRHTLQAYGRPQEPRSD